MQRFFYIHLLRIKIYVEQHLTLKSYNPIPWFSHRHKHFQSITTFNPSPPTPSSLALQKPNQSKTNSPSWNISNNIPIIPNHDDDDDDARGTRQQSDGIVCGKRRVHPLAHNQPILELKRCNSIWHYTTIAFIVSQIRVSIL